MSDDYTPTTDEVREAYQASGDGLDFKHRYHERGAAFDRMIESVRGAERERIAQAVTVAASKAPVMMHLNEYPSRAVPKAELLALAARIARGEDA